MQTRSMLTTFNRMIEAATGLAELPGPVRRRVRGALLHQLAGSAPYLLLGAAIGTLGTALQLRGTPFFAPALAILLVLGIINMSALRRWRALANSGRSSKPRNAGAKSIRRVSLQAALMACVWSALSFMLMLTIEGADGGLVTGALIASVFLVTAFAYGSMLQGSLVFIAISGTVALITSSILLDGADAFVAMAFCFTYVFGLPFLLIRNARDLVGHLSAEVVNGASAERVGRLFADFQDSAAEWFWQTDAHGRLEVASPEFKTFLKLDGLEQRDRLPIMDRLENLGPASLVGIDAIRKAVAAAEVFREVEITTTTAKGDCVVRMSGKPILSNTGRVTGYVGVCTEISSITAGLSIPAVDMARIDTLTGVYSRSSFNDELELAVRQVERDGTPFTLMFIDLDKFKLVNDTYGHPAGDEL
ncbi:MAG: GGDEF domain-containing protein, partial [Pseudomonadota bacterium]